MEFYVETNYFDHDGLMNACGKGRDDYFEVLRRCGLKCIRISMLKREAGVSFVERIRIERGLVRTWNRALKDLGEGDTLFIHTPPSEKFTGLTSVIRKVRKRGCQIGVIVFDLEEFITPYYRKAAALKYRISRRQEAQLFRLADVMIVHNSEMKDYVSSMGIDPEIIVPVGVMDYLSDEPIDPDKTRKNTGKDLPVVFCGGLTPGKAGFLNNIPDELFLDVYGTGHQGRFPRNIDYRGAFDSMELMEIIRGSFGLVWDGCTADTCDGASGEYLKYNNPHKMALYLASGLPVIVWDESAMAEFVTKEKCGLTVADLGMIPDILRSLSNEDYELMRINACRIGSGMRKGVHISTAVERALGLLK